MSDLIEETIQLLNITKEIGIARRRVEYFGYHAKRCSNANDTAKLAAFLVVNMAHCALLANELIKLNPEYLIKKLRL